MNTKQINVYGIFMIFIIFLNEKFFYQADIYDTKWMDLLIGIFFISSICLFKYIIKTKYKFLGIINYFLILNIITMIITVSKYGQPFQLAILRYRYNLLYLLYLPLYIVIRKIGTEKVKKIIYRLGTILSLLYCIQAIIYPRIIIFNMNYMERSGTTRFFYGSYFVLISIFITLEILFAKFEKKAFISLLIQISFILFVCQTRSMIIALIATVIIYIFTNLRFIKLKKLIQIIVSLIIISPFFSSQIKTIMNSTLETIQDKSSSSYVSRELGMQYMMTKLEESPVFGLGLYNSRYDSAAFITGAENKYYADDIGIIGFLFQYGYTGVALYIILTINIILRIVKIQDKNKKLYYSMFIIYNSTILPFNCILNISNCIIYLIITLCMMEIDCNNEIIINGDKNI